MNKEQLLSKVVRPTLQAMPNGWSAKAELAILMIIAHESLCGEYIAQLENGLAKGIIQMEGWVHDDVWAHSDSIRRNAVKLGFVHSEEQTPHSDRLYTDLAYNVFMARQRLFMDVNPLPNEPLEMSRYLKKFWNSECGKATDTDYLDAYTAWS